MTFGSLCEVYSIEEMKQLELVRATLLENPEAFEVEDTEEVE